MPSVAYDIAVEKGSDTSVIVSWQNPDGTPIASAGWSARLQVREDYGSPAALLTLSTDPGGGLAMDLTKVIITVTITAAQSAVFDAPASLPYDLVVTDGAAVHRLLRGRVVTTADVTQ